MQTTQALLRLAAAAVCAATLAAQSSQTVAGTPIDPATTGPGWIETMDEVLAREALRDGQRAVPSKVRGGSQGRWEVPSKRWTRTPHSGERYAAAKWGDTRMGIAFGGPVDLTGVWVGGHMDPASWAAGVRLVGYREGEPVGATEWFHRIEEQPLWLAAPLAGVDRVVFESAPAANAQEGAAFFAIDDLTFVRNGAVEVIDFEDAQWKAKLTGSSYRGLDWESGTGDFALTPATVAPAPVVAPVRPAAKAGSSYGPLAASAMATAPTLVRVMDGPIQSDPGAGGVPDTMGAVGTTQFVVPLNFHMSIYDKATEARLANMTLNAFFNTTETTGDPRVVFDHHENRWIVLASDWSTKLWLAYSLTDDAMGAWFKTTVTVSVGANAGNWADYPTLGVDANGIYSAALMVPKFNMTIFAFDKSTLLGGTPTVTGSLFTDLPYEEAIQPCVTYGSPAGEYFVSFTNATSARIRRVNPPLSAATLTEVGLAATQVANPPNNAPSQGASTPIDTHPQRHMNAVYRNGSVWTAHAVARNGRSAVGWYEIDAASATVVQEGYVEDPVEHYYVPTIAVNAASDVLLAFSGSSATSFIGAWYTGRSAADPAGTMADEALFQAGTGAFNQFGGAQRWGDYTMTSVDPVDDSTMWTIQQVAAAGNQWNMHIAEFGFEPACGTSVSYCTAGTSASGCQALLSTAGTPSATAASGFDLVASSVEGAKDGLYFFAANGRQANPWGSGTSFQCVAPPVMRGGLLTGSGTTGACDGSFAQDLNARWTAKPAQNPGAGAVVQAQLWYRDPLNTSNQTTSLSDAVEFTVCP